MKIDDLKGFISRNKVLVQNFGYLSLLQIYTLLLPLITYPYLIRILGKDIYGIVIYAQSIVAYLSIIVNFGFNVYAAKDISINRHSKIRMSLIVSSIYIVKTFICIILFVSYIFIICIFNYFEDHFWLYFTTFFLCLGEVLFPVWFYQGIEKMKYTTIINVVIKSVFSIFIFVFIHSESDYLWVPILWSIGPVIAGILSFYILFSKENVFFIRPSFWFIKKMISKVFPFFVSRVSAVVNTQTNVILLGAFVGMKEVAYYDLAKKIVQLLVIPNTIINQVAYPRIAYSKDKKVTNVFFKINICIGLFLTISLYLLGYWGILFLGGKDMLPALSILYTMGILVLVYSISYYIGNCVLVSFNMEKYFNNSVVYATLLYLVIVLFLVFFNIVSIYTVAVGLIIVECCCMLYRLFYTKQIMKCAK